MQSGATGEQEHGFVELELIAEAHRRLDVRPKPPRGVVFRMDPEGHEPGEHEGEMPRGTGRRGGRKGCGPVGILEEGGV